MIHLKPVQFTAIAHWGVDYQKKSKNFELIPDYAQIFGIFRDEEMIGYFALIAHKSGVVEINQGYLKPDARHKSYNRLAMEALEKMVKGYGMTQICLATNRAVGSYQRFMSSLGFDLTRAIFTKEVA